MTKNDFILNTMMHLAASDKYGRPSVCKEQDGTIIDTPGNDALRIYLDAKALADIAEEMMAAPFDGPYKYHLGPR